MAKPAEINHVAAILELDQSAATLDLVHLSRQTLGDHELETELLTLFDRQAAQFAARLAEPRRPGDVGSRGDLAHTLKGSSRAVGAFAVGVAAEAYEASVRAGAPADELCETLIGEIRAARAAIAELLERA